MRHLIPSRSDTADSSLRVGLFIAVAIALYTFSRAFSAEKLQFLYKDVLHLSASGTATLVLILGIPAYLRPVMGAGSDLFPLFGFRRKTYFALWCVTMSLGYLGLALVHSYAYWKVVCLVLIVNAGNNFMLVIVDAVMVAVGNANGTTGRLQTVQQGVQLVLGLVITSNLSGLVTQNWTYSHCFFTAALVSMALVPLALMIPETGSTSMKAPADGGRSKSDQSERLRTAATLKSAAASPGLWAIVGFIFYLIITPGIDTAKFYYSVDVLHFSKLLIGRIGIANSAGSLAAIALFAVLAKRLPVRAMVWGAYLMDCFIYLIWFLLRDAPTGYVCGFLYNMDSMIYMLCLYTIAARACPPGIEGTVYGLVLATITLAANLGEQMGASIYNYFGPPSHHSTTYGWHALLWFGFAFTVIAVVFIPYLPAWARSNQPLHPQSSAEPEPA